MSNAIAFVFTAISQAVAWLGRWQFLGIPFLYFLLGIAIISVLMRMAL